MFPCNWPKMPRPAGRHHRRDCAGSNATANFEIRYHDSGQHTITARLPADAVATDNARYSVLDFPQSVPVLVIDGDPRAAAKRGDAYFIALPFASSQIAPTGIKPQIEASTFLRDHPLDGFHVIYLLNIDRLDQPRSTRSRIICGMAAAWCFSSAIGPGPTS